MYLSNAVRAFSSAGAIAPVAVSAADGWYCISPTWWPFSDANVQTAVDGLSSVASATVSFSAGSAACSGGGIGIIVTFTGDAGNQAAMTSAVAALGNAPEVQTLVCTATALSPPAEMDPEEWGTDI